MGDFVEFLKNIKDWSWRQIIIGVLAGIVVLCFMKIEVLIPLFKSTFSSTPDAQAMEVKKTENLHNDIFLVDPTTTGIKPTDMSKIEAYVDNYVAAAPPSVLMMGVYKFLPEGDEYLFQGRVLIILKSSLSNKADDLIREMNLRWIPMWSGRKTVELTLEGAANKITINPEKHILELKVGNATIAEKIPSLNIGLLESVGAKVIYQYPITKGDRIVGYLYWVLDRDMDADTNKKITDLSEKISSQIVYYLVSR